MAIRPQRGFTLLEALLACSMFILLSVVLVASLNQVTSIWRRTNGRDDAVRQILKAKAALGRDLANSSALPGMYAKTTVTPHLGTSPDGDAITFLTSDDGSTDPNWMTQSTGQAVLQNEITYYLVIPTAPNPYGIVCSSGVPDSAGYEQQSPFKWLMRRVDPTPSSTPVAISSTWTNWLTQPSSLTAPPSISVVSDQLLSFEVTGTPPSWSILLRAVAVSEATHNVAVGTIPLSQSPYTVSEQLSAQSNN